MQLSVAVTRLNIEEGTQAAARKCAVALAAKPLFPWAEYVAATYDYLFVAERVEWDENTESHWFGGRYETWALDETGSHMVNDFDRNGRAAIPRIFKITRDYTGR
jgi:hypothetical protein